MRKHTLTITETETLERIVLRTATLPRCSKCIPSRSDWLSLYAAREMSGLSTSTICRLVEERALHAAHTEAGHLLICSASLRKAY